MSEINPYESPRAPEPILVAELVEPASGGVWRQGNLLVMHKRATLPDRCVKSNEPAHGRRLLRDMFWHPPWIYLTIFIGLLVYVILVMMLRKRATIRIGLSKQWFAKRRRAILIGWGLVLSSAAMVVGGISKAGEFPYAPALIPLGFVVFLVGAIYGLIAARMVAPARITDDYVWVKGVHPDFLASLPNWPYPP
ncbi:MAG: hypothetical protein ACYSWU_11130 [Planctomycetota bacterium]|jgi:hypothetical protein